MKYPHSLAQHCALTAILVILLLLGSAGAAVNAASSREFPPPICGFWNVSQSMNPSAYYNNLAGIAVVSGKNVWAVGTKGVLYHSHIILKTLIEHWNGFKWVIVPSPNVGSQNNSLSKAAASSASDIWAVGSYNTYTVNNDYATATLIEHWNGSRWSIVPSPNPGPYINLLTGITVVSATDAWAVGQYTQAKTGRSLTLIEHWNGSRWSIIHGVNPGISSNNLRQVSAVSAQDIWAAGSFSNDNAHDKTLIEHWNGSQWTVIPSPNVTGYSNDLLDIKALSPQFVMAVGFHYAPPGNINDTLVEYWDGKLWTVAFNPEPGLDDSLQGVAVTWGKVWAVGSSDYHKSVIKPLIEQAQKNRNPHWSVDSHQSSNWSTLMAVATDPIGGVWAVGYRSAHGGSITRTLIEHYC